MKWLNKISIVLLAVITSFLDASFLSALPVYGATLLSSFVLIIVFALLGDISSFLIFVFSVSIMFAIFSSVPLWFIIIAFFLLPALILFLRKNYLPLPSTPASLPFFLSANLIFEFLLLLNAKAWSAKGFLALAYFVIINTALGAILYYITKRLRKRYLKKEMKLN